MSIVWLYPWRLLLSLPVVVVLGWLMIRSRGLSWKWKLRCVICPGVAVLFLVMCATRPIFRLDSISRRVVVLLDRSAAARNAPWVNPRWLRQFLQSHLPRGTLAKVVGFGIHPHVLISEGSLSRNMSWPRVWPRKNWSHAVIKHALGWTQPGWRHSPRWLFTTGLCNWPTLPVNKLPYYLAVTVVRPIANDVGIINLTARQYTDLHSGIKKVELTAMIRSTGPGKLVFQAYRNGTPIAQNPLHFRRGGMRIVHIIDTVPQLAHTLLRYRIDLKNYDLWPEDNQAHIIVLPSHPKSMLIVTRKPSEWKGMLSRWNLHVTLPLAMPTTLEQMSHFNDVILSDIPQSMLSPETASLLKNFSQRTGGGVLIAGSCCAFGPGGYADTPDSNPHITMEELSPLSCVPPNHHPTQVIFLIDGSGSMGTHVPRSAGQSRFNLATRAVLKAITVLQPKDHVVVLTFNSQTRLLLSGTMRNLRDQISVNLSRVLPTGATNPDSFLKNLAAILRQHSILILLTDGRIPRMNVTAWSRLIKKHQTQLIVIASPPKHSLVTPLVQATGAIQFSTTNPTSWPHLLQSSIAKKLAGKAETTSLDWISANGRLRGTTRAWIQVYLKRHATVLAESVNKKYPLAAYWRIGLGHIAALAFDEDSKDYSLLLQKIIQLVSPPTINHNFVITLHDHGNVWFIQVDGQHGLNFINGAKLAIRLNSFHGIASRVIRLPQVGPGKYAAQIPMDSHALAGTIIQWVKNRWILVGRITGAKVPGPYFPATADNHPCPWNHCRFIALSTLPHTGSLKLRWQPRFKGRMTNILPLLEFTAIVILINSLWMGKFEWLRISARTWRLPL